MCTVLLPPGGYPTEVNKYIIEILAIYLKSCGCIIEIVFLPSKDGIFPVFFIQRRVYGG